jgi:O-methyltransferase
LRRDAKLQLYDMAAELIGDAPITYLEFGVHKGWSIDQIARRFSNPGARFYGIDSFEGLPEAYHNEKPGHFSTGGAVPALGDERISFVKGWFQDTLPPLIAGVDQLPNRERAHSR